jgi:hypothetical protein
MKRCVTLLTGLLIGGAAGAGDVFVITDAQGQKTYTDTPHTVPARKLDIRSPETDSTREGSLTLKNSGKPDKASANDQTQPSIQPPVKPTVDDYAARCPEVRQQYQTLLNYLAVYKLGPNGEPIALTVEEVSAARVKAKRFLDQFCAGP